MMCILFHHTECITKCLSKMQLRTTKPDRSTAWENEAYFVRKQRENIEWCVQSEDFFFFFKEEISKLQVQLNTCLAEKLFSIIWKVSATVGVLS